MAFSYNCYVFFLFMTMKLPDFSLIQIIYTKPKEGTLDLVPMIFYIISGN